jgi:hypothetical protein
MRAPNRPRLTVTQLRGKLLAAYCYLAGKPGQRSHRTRRVARGLVADFARNGRALGIEITAPRQVTMAALNRAIRKLGWPELDSEEFGPLAGERRTPAGPRVRRTAPPSGGRQLGALPTTETTYTVWCDGPRTIVRLNSTNNYPVVRGTSFRHAEIERRRARTEEHWKKKRRKASG